MAVIDPAVETGKRPTPASTKPAALTVHNVLFATDFSATSEAALPYAAAISRRFGSTLHVAHVLSDVGLWMMTGGVDYVSLGTLYEDEQNQASQRLAEIAGRLEGIPHRCYVRHGQVAKSLAAIIEGNKVDLIVLGTHGRSGLGKLMLGSVAEDILRHAPCPVLTVGPKVCGRTRLPALQKCEHDLAPPELDLRRIVVAANFTHSSERVAQVAVRLAEEFRSQLTLTHVVENYHETGNAHERIEDGIRRLRALIPPTAALQYTPETVLEFGAAADGILRVTRQREADLIVLGARSIADLATTHLPWSTAHQVLAQARCPLLTVPA